jgi:hypothetical protein
MPKRSNPDAWNEVSVKPAPKRIEHGYDRSSHHPGNPGFSREGKPPYKEFDGGAHARQSHGHPIGTGTASAKPAIANIKAEGSKPMGEVANVGTSNRGSKLVGNTHELGDHCRQPQGHSIGAGRSTSRAGESMGGGKHTFRGMKSSPTSKTNGGHRIGRR